MTSLHDKIDTIFRDNMLGIRGEISQAGIVLASDAIRMDHAVSMIPDEEYDAILIAVKGIDVKLGRQYMGTVFNDKKQRFHDGAFLTIGTVQNIAYPIDGLKLISTKRTTYLVI